MLFSMDDAVPEQLPLSQHDGDVVAIILIR
jgi:hypothetical protein